jgi:hypothetical protein
VLREEFVAGLVFNVGRADEQLVNAGVTHLLEHLALPPLTSQAPPYGGSVSATATDLWFTGSSPEEALNGLSAACRRIAAFSQESFERERRVLRAEADRSGHPLNRGLALRYGARGVGLAGFPQLALGWLEPADVRRWGRQYLTAGNAALWMNFEAPADFEVPLPEGELNVREEPGELDGLAFPAFATGRPDEVVLHLLRPRSAVGVMATQLVARHLLAELRAGRGFSYSVMTAEEPLTPLAVAATIVSDVRTEHAAAAVDVVSHVLARLAVEGCAERELAEITEGAERHFADPRSLTGLLRGNAAAALGAGARLEVDAYLSELRAVTPASIAACVSDMASEALLLAPPPAGAPLGFSQYPSSRSRRVAGRRHQWRSTPKHAVSGAGAYFAVEGLSVVYADGREVTIDLSRAPLMQIVDDARRALWGIDGGFVEIDRESFKDGDDIIDALDKVVPASRVRVDQDRRRDREAVRTQVAVLFDARRRLISSLALIGLVIGAAIALRPTGTGLPFIAVIISSLAWRAARVKLRPVQVGAITTTVQQTLQPGEQLELLATGKLQGQAVGLIIVTNLRFVFVQRGTVQIAVARADLIGARSSWLSSTLRIQAPQRTIRFDYVTRRNRAKIASALNTPPIQLPASLARSEAPSMAPSVPA